MDAGHAPQTPLDDAALKLFEAKGLANGVKVRRVMQCTADLARRPWSELRILDLGCGEGVYAVEAALRGAEVVAVDGRNDRMSLGKACAERHGLSRLTFHQADVRTLSFSSLGAFDVIFFLGLLYHLDEPQVFTVLEQAYDACRGFMILDTHIALRADMRYEHRGRIYSGTRWREHGAEEPAEVRLARTRSSLENPDSCWFDRESLLRLLQNTGFTSVFECHVPSESNKPADRITLVACKGSRETLASYPWVNGRPEEEIRATMQAIQPAPTATNLRGRLAAVLRSIWGSGT